MNKARRLALAMLVVMPAQVSFGFYIECEVRLECRTVLVCGDPAPGSVIPRCYRITFCTHVLDCYGVY